MKVICSNCRTMNLLPETMADAPISRMTCARCGNVMDLPVESPAAESPEVNAPLPELRDDETPVVPATIASSVAASEPAFEHEEESNPEEVSAAPDEEEYETGYEVPVIPRDRTGNILKYLSFLLVFVAIMVAVAFLVWPSLRPYLAKITGSPANANSAAPVPANSNTTAGTDRPVSTPISTPSPNVNLSNTANTGNTNAGLPANPANANANNSNTSNQNSNSANRNDANANNTNRSNPPTNVNQAPVASGSGSITIQVGSHPDPESANQQVARLQSQGIGARMVRADIPGRGTWYRVQVGRFATRGEADRYAAQLRSKGLNQIYITSISQ